MTFTINDYLVIRHFKRKRIEAEEQRRQTIAEAVAFRRIIKRGGMFGKDLD